ncbi:MAG: low molecular weight protein-tyrosine-phosphatase [Pseudomonadota bacterium]
MTRILLVCLGNICRSPAAEGVLRTKAMTRGVSVAVDSAGTGGWHAGDPPDERMQAAAARRRYDLSALSARQVVPQDFNRFDLIFAMDRSNLANLEAMAPVGGMAERRLFLGDEEVPDPYYGGEAGFEHVLDLIEAAADRLLDELVTKATGGRATD